MTTSMRWIALALLLVGCATTRTVVGPDGTPAVAIEARSVGDAYEAAGQRCPRGYAVLDQGTRATVVPTPNGPVGGTRHTLLVRCRQAGETQASR